MGVKGWWGSEVVEVSRGWWRSRGSGIKGWWGRGWGV